MAFDRCNAGQTHVTEEADQSNGESVRIAALDDLLAENQVSEVDYLKIDVEGYEKFVLAGAERTIAKSLGLIVQMELVQSHAARYRVNNSETVEILRNLQFLPYQLDKAGRARELTDADPLLEGEIFWSRKPVT
jgi:hypothetical protein